MTRLYRPHIPLKVRCQVAARQIGNPALAVPPHGTSYRDHLLHQLFVLGAPEHLNCSVDQMRLDHDPPLAARPRFRRGLGKKTYYQPPANDPDHLFYRPHGPEFEGSHLIKTNVRGDHGQYPDRVLIKRERRRTKPKKRKGQKIRSRGFQKGHRPLQSRNNLRRKP
jgi:hypothetical protein